MISVYDRVVDAGRGLYGLGIHTPAVLDEARFFPGATRFKAEWRGIAEEVLALDRRNLPRFHDLMPEQAEISANDGRDWKMFVLKAYGVAVPENLARVPKLAGLLAQSPEVLSAAVSALAPGKHIPEHRGPFRGILRFHLMLKSPRLPDGRPAAVLFIDGVPHRMADGETLLWDDTYRHEVRNECGEERVALLLDVKRPGMPLPLEIISSGVAAAIRLGMKWRGVSFAA